MQSNFFLFALFLTVILSCKTSSHDLKIYGGTKVEKDKWPSAVALTSKKGIFCTGTIVHPTLIITAGHCLSRIKSPDEIKIYLGEGEEGRENVHGQYEVKSFKISPDYGWSFGAWNDMAYVISKESLPIEENEIPEILVDEEEQKQIIRLHKEVHIVGYGKREGGKIGIKYEAIAPIVAYDRKEVDIGGEGKDSCTGDSGGPAYGQLENGQWRVFGIVSKGSLCGWGGTWARMSAQICWLLKDSGYKLKVNESLECS